MNDDKMRAEFEAWAAREEYNLVRYSWPDEKHSKGYGSEYADNKTTAAEHGYQAGYQAGRKAEREAIFIEWENGETLAAEVERLRAELAAAKAASEAIVSKLRNEIDHATCNDMRLPPMFGQWKGELAVRVGALQAVIDSTTPPTT